MTSPYRSDLDALRERLAGLEAELARLRAQSAELDAVRAREAVVARELADVQRRIGEGTGKRGLPLLDQVKVASPCSADWNEMLGDERVRFCLSCEKNVYNLSAMPRDEAEALLASRAGGELCVRYYRRADGTILTSDCPVGAKKKRRKQLALAVAGAGAMAAAAMTAVTRSTCRGYTQGEMPVAGGMMVPVEPTVPETAPPLPVEPEMDVEMGDREPTPHVMGKPAIRPMKMGRIAAPSPKTR